MHRDPNYCNCLLTSSTEGGFRDSPESCCRNSRSKSRNYRQLSRVTRENKYCQQSLRNKQPAQRKKVTLSADSKLTGTKLQTEEVDPVKTKQIQTHNPTQFCGNVCLHRSKHRINLANAKLSAESSDGGTERELCSEKAKGGVKFKRQVRRGSRKLVRQNSEQRLRSSSSENSRGSLVVLYCSGHNKSGRSTCSSSDSIVSQLPRSRQSPGRFPSESLRSRPIGECIKWRKPRGRWQRWSGSEKHSEKQKRGACGRDASKARPPESTDAKEEKPPRRLKGGAATTTTAPADLELCQKVDETKLMARRTSAKEPGCQQQNPRTESSFVPELGLLMQHLHEKQNIKATGDSSLNTPKESERVFPFKTTPSGHLKIVPNQIVFESKKVSVLVADPRYAKVNVKAELQQQQQQPTQQQQQQQQQQKQQKQIRAEDHNSSTTTTTSTAINMNPPPIFASLPPGITASTVDRLQAQRKLPAARESLLSEDSTYHNIECKPRTQPINRAVKAQPQEQQLDDEGRRLSCPTVPQRTPVLNDVPLSYLGFTTEQPIDWKNITLPEKTDLYQELSKRITTYKNADCIVRIDYDEFHCHLLVLQSYSTFFDSSNAKEIDLTGSTVTSKAFSIIYDWMISPTNESCHLLRRDNILEIFLAAQNLGIKELEEQCWAFIDNDELFSEDTAFMLYLEARKIGNNAVMELMVPRIMKFFLMLVSTKDFLELSVDELCLLLRSNYVCVNSEMEILMSGVRWLMHDWENRKQHLLDVMKCVRFGLIAPWQLVDVKRNPENPEFIELVSHPEVEKMVDDGLAFVIIKYWYGNQTEDYYHWIDLLGLSEPTNRNWAGEDKNYVTYREFLLYLEEYQRTKLPEFKNKSYKGKKAQPPKEDSVPAPPPSNPPSSVRSRNPNSKFVEVATAMSAKPSTLVGNGAQQPHQGGGGGSGGMPGMMPPEILSQYLCNIGRSSVKSGKNERSQSPPRPTNSNLVSVKKFSGGGDHFVKLMKATWPQSTDKRPKEGDNKNLTEPGVEDDHVKKIRSVSTVKSEEEAATTIQAMFRGYKTRRKYKNLKKGSQQDYKRHTKEVSETLSDQLPQKSPVKEGKNCPKTVGNIRLEEQGQDVRQANSDNEIYQTTEAESEGEIYVRKIMSPAFSRTSLGANSTDLNYDSTDTGYCNESKLTQESKIDGHKDLLYANDAKLKKKTKTLEMMRISNCKQLISSSSSEATCLRNEFSLCTKEVKESILVLGGIDPHAEYGRRGNTGRDIYRYSAAENNWDFVGEMPEPRHHHSVAYLSGRIYLIGGADPQKDDEQKSLALATVWSYDPRTKVWYNEPSLLTPRQNFGVVVHDEKIYVIGGQNERGVALRSVEVYNPQSRKWRDAVPLLTARTGPACVVYEGHIWVAGGMTKSKKEPITNEVECYDFQRNQWFKIEPLRFTRCFSSLHVLDNRLFIIGGAGLVPNSDENSPVESTNIVDCWNTRSCSWQKLTEFTTPRHGHTVSSFGDDLIILGGVTTLYVRALKSVECYCSQKNKWINGFASLPFPISGHGSVCLPTAHLTAGP